MKKVKVLAIVCMLLCWTHVGAQTLSQSVFDVGQTTVAKPTLFEVIWTNNSEHSIWYKGATCDTTDEVIIEWLGNANTPVTNQPRFPPGHSGAFTLRVTPLKLSDFSINCFMNFVDSLNAVVGPAPYTVSGVVNAMPELFSTLPVVDFGDVGIDENPTISFFIKNVGNGDAYIRDWKTHHKQFDVHTYFGQINVGDSMKVTINLRPRELGTASEWMELGYKLPWQTSLLSIPILANIVEPKSGLTTERYVFVVGGFSGQENPMADTQQVSFTTTLPEVTVVSARLAIGVDFRMDSVTVPLVVTPSQPFVTTVIMSPVGNQWSDTLILVTSEGQVAKAVLDGYGLVSVAHDVSVQCNAHPNPSSGAVYWCGTSLERWRVVNSLGVVVATVTADDAGNLLWHGDQAGYYMLVSERTATAIPCTVIR